MMRTLFFWGSLATIAYTYVGFPLLLYLRARLLPRPYRDAKIQPMVSIVIAAYNEAASIESRLENLASMDYPADRIEILVVSDGSTDATEEIVSAYEDPRVRLLRLPRGGKARALNQAVAVAQGDILVFSDANSVYDIHAITNLVRPLADPEVGAVAGDQRYVARDASGTEVGERRYWDLDRRLKRWESAAGSTVTATGAIYAVRRSLYRNIPDGLSDDFLTSVGVVAQGYRLIFAEDAVAFEPVAASQLSEFRRKTRIASRTLQSEVHMRGLLDPRRHGFFSLQLLSHKPLRRLAVIPMLIVGITSVTLWPRHLFYRGVTVAQGVFYLLSAAGIVSAGTSLGRRRILALPAYFCLVYAAQLVAVWNLLRGRRITMWQQERRE